MKLKLYIQPWINFHVLCAYMLNGFVSEPFQPNKLDAYELFNPLNTIIPKGGENAKHNKKDG